MDEKIPQSIGVIIDGNRRWAKQRGMATLEGHRAGLQNLRLFLEAAREVGIKYVYVYMFSTENWNRTSEEVSYLLTLFENMVKKEFGQFTKEQVAIRFLGERERFPEKMQKLMNEVEKTSPENPVMTVGVCLSYGGRTELLKAVEGMVANGEKNISEETFEKHLWSSGMPDPDLIIRTGGEKRLSNFLTWQSTYSELFFSDTMWPDFSKEEFHAILKEYGERERRRGK